MEEFSKNYRRIRVTGGQWGYKHLQFSGSVLRRMSFTGLIVGKKTNLDFLNLPS